MGIINTQAVADGRKVRTGKDGALYNGKGKLLATVEVWESPIRNIIRWEHHWNRKSWILLAQL